MIHCHLLRYSQPNDSYNWHDIICAMIHFNSLSYFFFALIHFDVLSLFIMIIHTESYKVIYNTDSFYISKFIYKDDSFYSLILFNIMIHLPILILFFIVIHCHLLILFTFNDLFYKANFI